MLLVETRPVKVFASITEVASGAPFQRTTSWLEKLVPVTFIVTAFDPATIVCGLI